MLVLFGFKSFGLSFIPHKTKLVSNNTIKLYNRVQSSTNKTLHIKIKNLDIIY